MNLDCRKNKSAKLSFACAHGSVRPGYTLAELLVVMGILLMLFAMALQGLVNPQRSFAFNNAYQKVIDMVRQARSLAVTAKAQFDYTDYDNDGCKDKVENQCAEADLVTPAHYGIYFDTATEKMMLFADLHVEGGNSEGVFVTSVGMKPGERKIGNDLILDEYTLPANFDFVLPAANNDAGIIFYNPVYADTIFDKTPDAHTMIFGVKENGGNGLKRCSKIQAVSGIPENATDNECI